MHSIVNKWPGISFLTTAIQFLLMRRCHYIFGTSLKASARYTPHKSIIVECLVAGTPQYYQGASEKQTLDSELALIITQVYTSLNDLLPAYASSEQPGNPSAADFRLLQGRRAAQQLQIVREAILNLNSLDDISNVLRDFLQLCYSTVTAVAKVVNHTG